MHTGKKCFGISESFVQRCKVYFIHSDTPDLCIGIWRAGVVGQI
jgi:hypothetical protein